MKHEMIEARSVRGGVVREQYRQAGTTVGRVKDGGSRADTAGRDGGAAEDASRQSRAETCRRRQHSAELSVAWAEAERGQRCRQAGDAAAELVAAELQKLERGEGRERENRAAEGVVGEVSDAVSGCWDVRRTAQSAIGARWPKRRWRTRRRYRRDLGERGLCAASASKFATSAHKV